MILIVLPKGFREGDPVCAYWKWTNQISKTASKFESPFSVISFASTDTEGRQIQFTLEGQGYSWKIYAKLKPDNSVMGLSIKFKDKLTKLCEMGLKYSSETDSCSIYTGLLNYDVYADDQMIIIIVPEDLAIGKTICACWQWSRTYRTDQRVNMIYHMTIDEVNEVKTKRDKQLVFRFSDKIGNYYRFDGTYDNVDDNGLMALTLGANDGTKAKPFIVRRSYPRQASGNQLFL